MEEKKEPTAEELRKQQEEITKKLQEKIMRASREIDEILRREGLDVYVDHIIRIIPKQRE